jgi:hypothetical protein
MAADLIPAGETAPRLPEREEAALLSGILAYNQEIPPDRRKVLVRAIMQRPAREALAPVEPQQPASSALLLRPGVAQAVALGANYGIVLGLDLSGALQTSSLPPQALLLGVNYVLLTGLMLSLSLVCLVHSFLHINSRPAYRALLVAMAATGLFGLMETLAFSVSADFTPLVLLLFVITVPLTSLFVALYSIARGLTRRQAEHRATLHSCDRQEQSDLLPGP